MREFSPLSYIFLHQRYKFTNAKPTGIKKKEKETPYFYTFDSPKPRFGKVNSEIIATIYTAHLALSRGFKILRSFNLTRNVPYALRFA